MRFHKTRAQPLTRQFKQPKRADTPDLNACTAAAHGLLEPALDHRVVALVLHIDEIDDDQAGQVAKPQLPCDFLGCLFVGLQRRFLDVALAGRTPRVYVDRHQRLGRADHDRAAGAQLDDGAVDFVELIFDLVAVKKRHFAAVVFLHTIGVRRQHRFHERLGGLVRFIALDKHLLDLARIDIPQ